MRISDWSSDVCSSDLGLAAATLILDGAKGAVAVLLARHFVPELGQGGAMIAGAAAMIGHCYPVWLKFRGGKGVATMLGLSLALASPIGLVFAFLWLYVVQFGRAPCRERVCQSWSIAVVAVFLQKKISQKK